MRRFVLPMVVMAGLVLAACGSSTPASSSTTGSTTSPTAGSTTGPTSSITAANPPTVENPTDVKTAPVIGPGTTPPPTGLETKDLVVGTGRTATTADTVQVQYAGADYTNGKDFDSSWSRGQAASFPLNGVVPGFSQGIAGMKIGGRREIVIPPSLGYGASGRPPAVGANETLVFVVDLLAIQ